MGIEPSQFTLAIQFIIIMGIPSFFRSFIYMFIITKIQIIIYLFLRTLSTSNHDTRPHAALFLVKVSPL